MIVGPSVPAAIVQSAPMWTSSSMMTPPSCGMARILPSGPVANPNPGAPMTAPAPIVTRAPIRTRGSRCDARADAAVGPDDGLVGRERRPSRAAPPSPTRHDG